MPVYSNAVSPCNLYYVDAMSMCGGRVEVTNVSAQYIIPVVTIHTLYMF